jgi:cyanosortase A-associated protein
MISLPRVARQSLLFLLCGSAICVLVTVITHHPHKSTLREPKTFNFPEKLQLPDSPILASKQLPVYAFKNGMMATGMSYHYRHNSQPIEIEARYITDGVANPPTTDAMLTAFTQMPATVIDRAVMKEQPGVGFYGLFVDRKTAYLTTCINPQGITTVHRDQFLNNSHPNPLGSGIRFDRLLPWLLGQQTLRDSRCIWTLLSTPIDAAAPDATIKTLETAGMTWIRWWQVHFPSV